MDYYYQLQLVVTVLSQENDRHLLKQFDIDIIPSLLLIKKIFLPVNATLISESQFEHGNEIHCRFYDSAIYFGSKQ